MRVRVRWSQAWLVLLGVIGIVLALRVAPSLLKAPEPPALPADVGLPRVKAPPVKVVEPLPRPKPPPSSLKRRHRPEPKPKPRHHEPPPAPVPPPPEAPTEPAWSVPPPEAPPPPPVSAPPPEDGSMEFAPR